jgi:hypothetical protein
VIFRYPALGALVLAVLSAPSRPTEATIVPPTWDAGAARVELVPEPRSGWTGLFATGATGLARVSSTTRASLDVELFAEGSAPVRLQATGPAAPRRTRFFEHDLTVSCDPVRDALTRVMFGRPHGPLHDVARVSREGRAVDRPAAPHRLLLVPDAGLRRARAGWSEIRPDATLYWIFGAATATSPLEPVGQLVVRR